MTASRSSTQLLLNQALGGSRECLGQLLVLYRNYLKLLVAAQFERPLERRLSSSDVIQETFLEANRDFEQFRGLTPGEFCAWLRRILLNNIHRAVEQHVLAEKRSVRREVSLDVMANHLEQSTVRLDAILAGNIESPSERMQRDEQRLELANQLAALPADYREVIVLRHLHGLPFEEVGKQMERTAGAARMLWLRAIRTLREQLGGSGDFPVERAT